jgi:iron complex outermembrane recepter protein
MLHLGLKCLAGCGVAAWAAAAAQAQVQAQQPEVSSLPTVVVKARAGEQAWREQPQHTTVITARDISRSTASNLAEVLSLHGNLNLQSYFGNDRNATLDIRGMGATASSNVLVLLDGVRLNANDLSGADLSGVSLDDIERIEVVRGGGSVLHGNGAVGGVIRISTRRSMPQGSTRVSTHVGVGSDERNDVSVRGAFERQGWGASAQLSQGRAGGYRDNGGLDTQGASLALRWSLALGGARADVHAKASRQHNRYGLPGPVSATDFAGSDAQRRSTRSPLDGGSTTVHRYELGMALDWGDWGRIDWHSSHADRRNPYFIGVNPARPLQDQLNQIVSGQWDHRVAYSLDVDGLRWPLSTTLGWDTMQASYQRGGGGLSVPGATLLQGDAASRAWFANATLHPAQDLALHAGGRWGRFESAQGSQTYSRECRFSSGPIPFPLGCTPYAYRASGSSRDAAWRHRALELGASLKLAPTWNAKLSSSRHFRAPNIDELLLADQGLRPQEGQTHEASVRFEPHPGLHGSATVFRIDNQSEIYYGVDAQGINSVNRNREGDTRRSGAEFELHWQPVKPIVLNAHVSYLVPRAQGLAGDIPLVPRTTASLQLGWQVHADWAWSLDGRFVGPRRDGNDTASASFARLPAFQVWNTGLRYQHKDLLLKLGVHNLQGEIYSTQAYSQTYYPMPQRQFYLTLDWSPRSPD